LIAFESQRLENTRKLNSAAELNDSVKRLSKRAKKRLEKLKTNPELDDTTKSELIAEIT
jgi:hypothetical protein